MENKRKSWRPLCCRHMTLNRINRMCAPVTLMRDRWGWAAKSKIRSAAGIRGERVMSLVVSKERGRGWGWCTGLKGKWSRAQEWDLEGMWEIKAPKYFIKIKYWQYYFNPSMGLIFLFSDPHHVHFNLAFAYIRTLGEEKGRRTPHDFLSLKLSLKITVCPASFPKVPVRKGDFAFESIIITT